jgi:dipeptidyl aminopeptidase/acylaminoacyl peptidase
LSTVAATAGVVGIMSSPVRGADAPVPLEVYGRLPSFEHLELSPDGKRMALVRTKGDERKLYVVDTSTGKELGGARVGDTKLRDVLWMDNDHLLAEVTSTSLPPAGFIGLRSEWRDLISYDVSKNTLMPISFRVKEVKAFNAAFGSPEVREVQGETTLFVRGLFFSGYKLLPGLFTFEPATNQMRLIRRAAEPKGLERKRTEWFVDGTGRVAGEYLFDDRDRTWAVNLYAANQSKSVTGKAGIDPPWIVGFDSNGKSIVMGMLENDEFVRRPISLSDGSMGPPLALADGSKLHNEIIDRRTGRILGGRRGWNERNYVFLDNEMQAHWNALLRAFPNERVDLESYSDDFSRIVVRVFGPKDGYVYALFDWYSHQAQVLESVYEGLTHVSEVKVVSYHAADGLEIPAIVTLPHGRAPTRLPLVVLPHGGPAVAEDAQFDWWAQALADQGYAVLQPNYRGSDLGEHFRAQGFGQWGRKMQTDLSDGVRYLAQEGIVDPKRVCIVGGSYGGYAALAGATLDSAVYRCAVSVAGISDLARMLKSVNVRAGDTKDSGAQQYWDRYMEVSGPDDPALKAISPIEHIDSVTAPILLIHGKDDTVVGYEQSEVMADALKKAGKPVQFVTLKNEDHWLSRGATRAEMLEATVAFLKANNPPD